MTPAARLVAPGLAMTLLAACSSNSSDATCDCPDPAITLSIPVDIAPSASPPVLSGTACTGVTPTCSIMAGGCSQYTFDANAAGTCTVEVDSANGVFSATLTITAATGCCTGYFASPPSSAAIVVPESDGGGG